MSEKHINKSPISRESNSTKSPLVREVESKSPIPQHDGRLVVGVIPKGYKQTSIGTIPQDWEVVRLGEVCLVQSGGTPPKNEKSYWENGTIKWLGSSVCKNLHYVDEITDYITQKGLDNSSAKIFKQGTTLIALVGATIGKIAYLNFDASTNQNIAGIYPQNEKVLNHIFLFYVSLILYKEFEKLSSDKFKMANLSFIKSLQIPLPPLKEQEKIARILGVWDSALTSLANLIKAKRKYKTALMQRLLTPPKDKSTHPLAPSAREGEQVSGNSAVKGEAEKAPPLSRGVWGGVSVPNDDEQEKCPRINKGKCVESPRANEWKSQSSLRFAGFSDKWQEFRLGDLFEITRGYVLPIKEIRKQQDKEYCYPVYPSQTLNGGLMGYYTNYLFENCITWTTDGANAGEVNFRTGKFYCTNVCGVLISKDGFANKCVAEIINSVSKKYVSYVGNPKLMNNVMSGIKVKIPTLAEQKKIAQVLSACDKEIETLNLKFECLKAQKRGLMQQLLSGKVRVKC